MKDEQVTVDFYLDIADSTQTPYIRVKCRKRARQQRLVLKKLQIPKKQQSMRKQPCFK
jgi:rRNA processing protein Gar1